MKQNIKQITSNHTNVDKNKAEFRQKPKYCDQIINCNDANLHMMLQLPGECHALWRDEQEQDLQVTTREGQTQLHPQSILRAVQYFQGSGLPWKGFRPASRCWSHTDTPQSHVWFQSTMRTTPQSSTGRKQDHNSSHHTRQKVSKRAASARADNF